MHGYIKVMTMLKQHCFKVVAQKLDDELKKRKVIDTDALGKKFKSFC